MLFLMNTVSYTAMTLPSMIDSETAFQKSEIYLNMQKQISKRRLMDVIHQTMRSGRILPMFSPNHRIQPPKVADVAAV